ncbi:hypothetical protein MVEN_02400500 [Mycena venus]|uniref:F-box domain-containing protein n=1 Tax=Mycena venus TaxID=2733690 RepID=A0A8H6X2C2_9AGAR|nr:hypothetical protein MVEN_02400500 [Mycena venus]
MVQLAGILDLPTEILVNILEHPSLPTDTLHALVPLCRRLHFIALPILLSRLGFTPNSTSVVLQLQADRRDLLAVFQMALLTPKPQTISCVFPHPSCTSIFPLLPHLKRLETFISCLPSVDSVTLELDTQASGCLAVGDDRALRAWAIHLESLLNCVVRKQCSSLTILHGGQFTRAFELVPFIARRGLIRRLFSALPKLLRAKGNGTQEFRRAPHQGPHRIEMGSCPYSAKLTSLDIRSAIFVVPPGLHWTLTALRNCRIQSLTLGRGVEESIIWSTVLPLIASAGRCLTSLTLLQADFLSEEDILDFVGRLPLLRQLTISSRKQTWTRDAVSGSIPLRALESLRAPPKFIQHFLHHSSPLPKINSICILWPQFYITTSMNVLVTALSTMLRTLDAHGRSPHLAVSINTMMYRSASLAHHASHDLHTFLDRVDSLEITAIPFFFTDITDMAAWIALFRRVRRVELTIAPTDDNLVLARLARAVQATEFLHTIVVNGESADLLNEGATAQ